MTNSSHISCQKGLKPSIKICLKLEDYNLERKIKFPKVKKCWIYYYPSKCTSLYSLSGSTYAKKQAKSNQYSEAKKTLTCHNFNRVSQICMARRVSMVGLHSILLYSCIHQPVLVGACLTQVQKLTLGFVKPYEVHLGPKSNFKHK